MAKRRKIVRRAALTPAQLRDLRRLKKATDAAYRNFWLSMLGIRPPRPPKIEPLLSRLGTSFEYIARILPPPPPPN